MATVTRVNGSDTKVGNLYSPNCFAYLITVKNTSNTAIDLQTEDTYGGNAVIGGVIESIVDEINPKAWYAPADSTGKIHVILDMNMGDASELQVRIRRIGKPTGSAVTTVGPNSIDISGTTVVAASSITIA
jgi:hypothetical protein